MSPNGKWVVTSGKDRSVRLWEKTQEILVLEDERETEREEEAEAEAGDRAAVVGEADTNSLASRRTADTERGAENLMEALEFTSNIAKRECEVATPAVPAELGANRSKFRWR